MGLFKRRRDDTAELAQLRTELDELRARLEATALPSAAPPPPPSSVAAAAPQVPQVPPVVDAAIDDLRMHVARIDEQLATIDQRVSSVSTELANQLNELSGDIESLGEHLDSSSDTTVDPSVLDELRSAQTRLANEQARYQIAFRQDLAELVEQLRRPGQA
jgi:Skp family chaperone for outer membrane proteins